MHHWQMPAELIPHYPSVADRESEVNALAASAAASAAVVRGEGNQGIGAALTLLAPSAPRLSVGRKQAKLKNTIDISNARVKPYGLLYATWDGCFLI